MKTLLIHQVGTSRGSGGAIATYRLHRALQDLGVESTLACQRREGDDPTIIELPPAGRLEDFLGAVTWRIGINDIHCLSTFKILKQEYFADADVVNVQGWHTNFFNYLALPRLSAARPLVATLHDMWNFTGHCGYSLGCERWKSGCGRCPNLTTFPPVARDATAVTWKLKQWAYRRSEMTVVVPSETLMEMVSESMLRDFPLVHIPNAVDTDVYRPLDRDECRAALGLPRDEMVVMFAAASLVNHVKGADLLVEALNALRPALAEQTSLLLMGLDAEPLIEQVDLPCVALGYVQEEHTKVQAYNAADAYVLPSRWENQNLTALEAMACGTPVVAFDTGGNSEIVRPGESGYLATLGDSDDLCNQLESILGDDQQRNRLAASGRRLVEQRHSMSVQAQSYIDLFAGLIRTQAA